MRLKAAAHGGPLRRYFYRSSSFVTETEVDAHSYDAVYEKAVAPAELDRCA
jgi:hypothetical protein